MKTVEEIINTAEECEYELVREPTAKPKEKPDYVIIGDVHNFRNPLKHFLERIVEKNDIILIEGVSPIENRYGNPIYNELNGLEARGVKFFSNDSRELLIKHKDEVEKLRTAAILNLFTNSNSDCKQENNSKYSANSISQQMKYIEYISIQRSEVMANGLSNTKQAYQIVGFLHLLHDSFKQLEKKNKCIMLKQTDKLFHSVNKERFIY